MKTESANLYVSAENGNKKSSQRLANYLILSGPTRETHILEYP